MLLFGKKGCVYVCVFTRFTHRRIRQACVILALASYILLGVCICACIDLCANHAHMCACVYSRGKKRRAFISTCQQWVFKDMKLLVSGCFLCLCIFQLDSVRQIKKYWSGNQKKKTSYSEATNSPAFVCGNAKGEREEEGNESEDGGMRRRRSAFTCGGVRRLMLACILEVICGRL